MNHAQRCTALIAADRKLLVTLDSLAATLAERAEIIDHLPVKNPCSHLSNEQLLISTIQPALSGTLHLGAEPAAGFSLIEHDCLRFGISLPADLVKPAPSAVDLALARSAEPSRFTMLPSDGRPARAAPRGSVIRDYGKPLNAEQWVRDETPAPANP